MSDLEQKLADTRARFLGKLARLRGDSGRTIYVGIVTEVSTYGAVYLGTYPTEDDGRIILKLDTGQWLWLEYATHQERGWEIYGE